ncbi:MAG: hypothetical protein KCHDKBKB_01129 [Elusimicrobia bacterium]|nr:hypothetical protein [Elusimicrobiota bacterium]
MIANIPLHSAAYADLMKAFNWGDRPTLVVGYGVMGREYVKALRVLGAKNLTVCSRSQAKLDPLINEGIVATSGGYERLSIRASAEDVAVVATSTGELANCVRHLLRLGYKTILCEKPVSLWSSEIFSLAKQADELGALVYGAFNRVAFPSVVEARFKIHQEGGATSSFYTFTELVHKLNLNLYSEMEKQRWGVANSIHVMSLAHAVIGMPISWNVNQMGSWPWHPSGSLFIGSGMSEQKTPFLYHADWGSAGRWSVEVFTKGPAFRFCPLEKLQTKKHSLAEWEDVPVSVFNSSLKPGLAEELAAMVDPEIRKVVALMDLKKTAELTRFTEDVFGYSSSC